MAGGRAGFRHLCLHAWQKCRRRGAMLKVPGPQFRRCCHSFGHLPDILGSVLGEVGSSVGPSAAGAVEVRVTDLPVPVVWLRPRLAFVLRCGRLRAIREGFTCLPSSLLPALRKGRQFCGGILCWCRLSSGMYIRCRGEGDSDGAFSRFRSSPDSLGVGVLAASALSRRCRRGVCPC